MKRISSLLALIIALTISGCAFRTPQPLTPLSQPSTSPSALPSESEPEPSPSPSPSESVPTETIFVIGTAECDFDEDGIRETVTIKLVDTNDGEVKFAEISGDNIYFKMTLDIEPMSIKQNISADLDGDGCEELLILHNSGGQGGYGNFGLIVLTLDNGSIRQIYTPRGYGFNVSGKLLPQFMTEIAVQETGKTFTYTFIDTTIFIERGCYSEDGELLREGNVYADGICYVKINDQENGVVEIGQYLWSEVHYNGEEFLVTELTFSKTGYTVVSQRIETFDYARQFVELG